MKNSRRDFLKQGASLAALSTVGLGATACISSEVKKKVEWPVLEGPDTPKM